MEKELLLGPMAKYMKGNILRIKKRVMGNLHGLIIGNTLECGKAGNNMEKGRSSIKMVFRQKVNG